MAGWQQVIIIGNLTADPEMKYTQSGTAVCSFGVAVNRTWNDRESNERKEEVVYFRVSVWRGLAETCNTYLKKGKSVMVAGRVTASAYTAQDGTAKASLDLNALDVQFLGGKGDGAQGEPGESEAMPF